MVNFNFFEKESCKEKLINYLFLALNFKLKIDDIILENEIKYNPFYYVIFEDIIETIEHLTGDFFTKKINYYEMINSVEYQILIPDLILLSHYNEEIHKIERMLEIREIILKKGLEVKNFTIISRLICQLLDE